MRQQGLDTYSNRMGRLNRPLELLFMLILEVLTGSHSQHIASQSNWPLSLISSIRGVLYKDSFEKYAVAF